MKTYIKNTFLIGAMAVGLVACNENSWNDHLDGFVGGPHFDDVKSMDYTLTATDYQNLAKNSKNVAKAEAANVEADLKAVGNLGYFTPNIAPADYIPAFLSDPNFEYFTLAEGSSINVTYKIAKDLPEEMIGMNAAAEYTVTKEDYQQAYGSDTDYAESFSPLAPASSSLPRILNNNFSGAEAGEYVVVKYNNSETSPVFSSTPSAEFELSDVLKDAVVGDEVKVNGVVTAVCARGFIVSDKSASMLVYFASYDNSYSVGETVELTGKVSAFNNGLQIDGPNAVIKKVGTDSGYTYPEAKVYSGSDLDAAIQVSENFTAVFCRVNGKVSISGNYYNLEVDGATTAQGSFYMLTDEQKAMLEDGKEYAIYGYFISVSKSGGAPKFFNIVMTNAEGLTNASSKVSPKVVAIPSTASTALYTYNGSAWAQVSDVTVLQPADYIQMGLNGTVMTSEQASQLLPTFLAKTYPYAQAETTKRVLYETANGFCSVEYTFNGTDWENTITDGGVISETNQFVYKEGGWVMDPSVTLELPAGKNKPTSTWFYQAVVDWVNANIPDASSYVDSYGTAEYYSGCSAYQGNVNINAAYATLRGNAMYDGMTDEEMVAAMKLRFETETAPGALSNLYPNMAPIGDYEPTVTITFTAWTTGGANKVYTIIFKCVAKGTFEFVSCTWNDPEA
ncbi:MAG: hypothetical protein HDS18_03115 [Bacteroides sp.]|nr:hypothetical protein [Bacteroides sp.]